MSINSNLRELNNKSNFLGPRYLYAIWSKKYFVLVKEKKAILTKGNLQGFAQWMCAFLCGYRHYFINEQMHDPDW